MAYCQATTWILSPSNIQEAEAPGRSPAEGEPVMKSGFFVRTIVGWVRRASIREWRISAGLPHPGRGRSLCLSA